MNTRKLIGLLFWLLAFAVPAHYALLSTEEVSNITGLVSFVAFMVLVFLGYWLVDSSDSGKAESHH
jgi:hypothetical protein